MKKKNLNRNKQVRALLIVDVQNDFIDGSLAVPDAGKIIPVINKLRSKQFDYIYVALDYHPHNHCSFRSNNPGSNLFEVLYLPSTGDAQRMWPDHCVQGSHGAELHKDLITEPSDILTYAGCNPRRDSYSVFKDNGSKDFTDMLQSLKERKVTDIYVCGLATDYTVQYSVLDCKVFYSHANVYVIQDGCKGLNEDGVKRALKTFEFEKIKVISSEGEEIKKLENRKLSITKNTILRPSDSARRGRQIFEEVDEAYEAILFGNGIDDEDINFLIKEKIINKKCSWSHRGLLHACCETGNTACLEKLIRIGEKHIDLALVSKKGQNPLHIALQNKNAKLRANVTKVLLKAANKTTLQRMFYTKSVDSGLTPLMYACRDGDFDAVELLLFYDSTPYHLQLESKFGKTAVMFANAINEPESAAIVELLLRTQPHGVDRLRLITARDSEGWNALHFGAKSGCFANVDWVRALGGEEFIQDLPVNCVTSGGLGFTMLQIAAFNNRAEVIRTLVDFCVPQNPLETELDGYLKLNVNTKVKSSGDTELDLAVKRRHLECARLLLRLGCYASNCTREMQQILHRMVLMGDVKACERILDFAEENDITIDEGLVVLTQRMEFPETCTFSFANYTHPVRQYLEFCEYCDTWVCLVCKDRCHGKDTCRNHLSDLDLQHDPQKGWIDQKMDVSYCECPRDSCCANYDMDAREREARTFSPQPIETTGVYLTGPLIRLSKTLATNAHNVWAQGKHDNGWVYGRSRDDSRKVHELLLPFDALSNEAAKYNVDIALETVKVILALGYEITKDKEKAMVQNRGGISPNLNSSASPKYDSDTAEDDLCVHKTNPLRSSATHKRMELQSSRNSLIGNKFSNIAWRPDDPTCAPIDTSGVQLPENLNKLVDCIAKNNHEVWAEGKIKKGWRYAPSRNIKVGLKLNSSLVPFEALDDQERNASQDGAIETVKAILAAGWYIVKKDAAELNSKSDGKARISSEAVKETTQENLDLKKMRQELFNQYLFASSRRGFLKSIDILISNHQHHSRNENIHVGANLNARDKFKHTALYIAIKKGHYLTAKRLLDLNVRVNIKDVNGLTPLALAAYLGHVALCHELVVHDADVLATDKMGFTPLHHAAYRGNIDVCQYLIECLQQLHQTNQIVNLNALCFENHSSIQAAANSAIKFKNSGAWYLRRFSTFLRFEGSAEKAKITPLVQAKKRLTNSFFPEVTTKPSVLANAKLVDNFDVTKMFTNDNDDDNDDDRITGSTSENIDEEDIIPPSDSSDDNDDDDEDDEDYYDDVDSKIVISKHAPLSLAVFSQQSDVVDLLIKRGANPMLEDGASYEDRAYAPYVRALLCHIALSDLVSELQSELASRAKEEVTFVTTKEAVAREDKEDTKNGENKPTKPRRRRPTKETLTVVVNHKMKLARRDSDSSAGSSSISRRTSSMIGDMVMSTTNKFFRKNIQENGNQKTIQDFKTTRQLNQELEDALQDYAQATKMIEVLNTSHKVRKWRNQRAIQQFVRETTLLLVIMLAFTMMVQIAPDYDSHSELEWQNEIFDWATESTGNISSAQDYIKWLSEDFLGKEMQLNDGIASILTYNRLTTGMKLERTDHVGLADDFKFDQASLHVMVDEHSLRESSITIPPIKPNDTSASAIFNHAIGSWDLDMVQRFKFQANLYNPFVHIYGILSVTFVESFYGSSEVQVDVKKFRLGYKRFPPSQMFQIVMSVMVLLFIAVRIRNWVVNKKNRAYTEMQWVATLLLLVILLVDYQLERMSHQVVLSKGITSEFVDYVPLHRWLQIERHIFAFFLLCSSVPLLSATRTIPSIGPVVVALLHTITDWAVLVYLIVVMVAFLLLALTFMVSFGTDANFLQITTTFRLLLQTPFMETWENIMPLMETILGVFLAMIFVLLGTVLLNLLVALISDLYPKHRRESDSLWESLITEGIENSLRYAKRKMNHKFTVPMYGKNDAMFQRSLDVEYWDEAVLLRGKDGIKHWKPERQSSSKKKGSLDHPHSIHEMLNHGSNSPTGGNAHSDRLHMLEKQMLKIISKSNEYDSYDADRGKDVNSPLQSPKQQSPRQTRMEGKMMQLETKLDTLIQAMCNSTAESPSTIKVGNSSYPADPPNAETNTTTPSHTVSQSHSHSLGQSIVANATRRKSEIQVSHLIGATLNSLIKDEVPCPLQRVKTACKANNLPWDQVKQVRRKLGIIQYKDEILVDGKSQTVRFWRRATSEEMDQLLQGNKL